MITIQVTYNGWIKIDVPAEDALRTNAYAYTTNGDEMARRLAEAIAGHPSVRRYSIRQKRAVTLDTLSIHGWEAAFIDIPKRDAYLAERRDG